MYSTHLLLISASYLDPNLNCAGFPIQHANGATVQAAGNKNPFLVTVILGCVQIMSMIVTSTLTDSVGRRPLTVYPYGVTVASVLSLGIVGCFDYKKQATSSLLVKMPSKSPQSPGFGMLIPLLGLLRLPSNILHHRRISHRLCLRRRNPNTTSPRSNSRLGSRILKYDSHYVQFLYTIDDQWECSLGCEDRLFVSHPFKKDIINHLVR